MNLHHLILAEEAIEVKAVEDLWQELKGNSKTYVSSSTYYVRPIEGSSLFEVMQDVGTKRTLYGKLTKLKLDASFVQVRVDQTPDAEGYIQYREAGELNAVEYSGDTVKVDLQGNGANTVKLVDGDYLIQRSDESKFVYSVAKAKTFEGRYTELK